MPSGGGRRVVAAEGVGAEAATSGCGVARITEAAEAVCVGGVVGFGGGAQRTEAIGGGFVAAQASGGGLQVAEFGFEVGRGRVGFGEAEVGAGGGVVGERAGLGVSGVR